MKSHTQSRFGHTSAPRLAFIVALLSLSAAPAWAGGYFSDREGSASSPDSNVSSPAAAVSAYAVDQNGVIVQSSHKVRARADSDSIVLQPVDSAVQIRVERDAGDDADRAQAALDAVNGNVYALASNNGGIIRATEARIINGRLWLTAGDGTAIASLAPSGPIQIASIAP
jgi:hypothetical protein